MRDIVIRVISDDLWYKIHADRALSVRIGKVLDAEIVVLWWEQRYTFDHEDVFEVQLSPRASLEEVEGFKSRVMALGNT